MANYDLKQFKAWIKKAIDNIEYAVKEAGEMQTAFNSEYVNKFKISYDAMLENITGETIKLYFNDGLDKNSGFYKSLQIELIDKNKTLTKKKNELEKKLTDIEKKINDIKSKKNSLINKLQKDNPELNELEEKQKKIIYQHEGSALTLKKNIKSLRRGFGFISNYFILRQLGSNLKTEVEVLKIEKLELQKIRNDYFKKKSETDNKIKELEESYRENIEITAAIRKDLSALQTAFETTCVLESIMDILEKAERADLSATKSKADYIDEFVKKREFKLNYEKSLKLVAEEIGFLTGIKSGFSNLEKTSESLLSQYNDYKSYLKPISFNLSDNCEKFRDNFKNFADKIVDDKKLSKTPADFIKLVSPFHDALLNEKTVKSIFEEIAAAIKTATKTWKQ
jgi:hypothetical protein